YPLRVPPLRERRGDIPLLAGHFLDLYRRRLGLGPVRLNEEARQALTSADFPGNVRELEHLLGRAILRASARAVRGAPVLVGREPLQIDAPLGPPLAPEPRAAKAPPQRPQTLRAALEETKRAMIARAVEENGGNWAAAARQLGMARGNLHHMATRLGLRK